MYVCWLEEAAEEESALEAEDDSSLDCSEDCSEDWVCDEALEDSEEEVSEEEGEADGSMLEEDEVPGIAQERSSRGNEHTNRAFFASIALIVPPLLERVNLCLKSGLICNKIFKREKRHWTVSSVGRAADS